MSDKNQSVMPPSFPENIQQNESAKSDHPLLSIIMANYNCETYLRQAIGSVLAQSFKSFELIVVDDASTDSSVDIIREISHKDSRLRLSITSRNQGPSAARNQALNLVQGKWIAVVDSDDILHPTRFANLLAIVERHEADIVSDNLIVFDDDGVSPPELFLNWSSPQEIDLSTYLMSNRLDGSQACLGVLKPMFRASLLAKTNLRYNETLLNAEDADLTNNMLAQGASMIVVPDAWYFYRKHGQSISRRLTVPKLASMIVAIDQFRTTYNSFSIEEQAALNILRRSYLISQDFSRLVTAAKARKPVDALAALRSNPYVGVQFAQMMLRLLNRSHLLRSRSQANAFSSRRQICFLSKGNILKSNNAVGVRALQRLQNERESGADIHLICLSPDAKTRLPGLVPPATAAVFTSIAVQRPGRIVGAAPRSWFRSVTHKVSRVAVNGANSPAADQLFVAAHVSARLDAVLCESAEMVEMIPYLLRPGVPIEVI